MTIRRVVISSALLACGLLTGVAQGQVVQWSGEPNTVQNPAGSHQLPSALSCTLPTNSLSPAPSCLTQSQSYNVIHGGHSSAQGVTFTWAISSGKVANRS